MIKSNNAFSRNLPWMALTIGSGLMLVPLAWMLLTSLKSFEEVITYPPVWAPKSPQWHNYAEAFTTFNFTTYLLNSIALTTLIILGTLVSSTLAAYAFACLDFPGKNVLFALLLSSMMLPGQITIIPLFQMYVKIHWINTYLPLVVPAWMGGNVFAIFLLRQFFMRIPRSLIEAARIDGASEPRILFSIFMPLSSPVLLTITVFSFIWSWNDLWGPLIYLHKENLYTMPIGLLNFMGLVGRPEGAPWHLVMAVSAVMMLPVVIVFFLAQKKFIEGIAVTGVKG